jgi:hypothetical protein
MEKENPVAKQTLRQQKSVHLGGIKYQITAREL